MATCLFCHQDTPDAQSNCQHCGMALPKQQQIQKERRLKHFVWFVIGLSLFCAFAIVWFGRTPPSIG